MGYRHISTAGAALAVALLLAGCATGGETVAEEIDDAPTPTVTASTEPTTPDEIFTMPAACDGVLPAARLADFDAQGLVLLGGPGGRYGNEYLLEPSPEESLGGITCIWGFSDSEMSSITVSVAPLAPTDRGPVVEAFVAEGLNESIIDGASIFAQEGDTTLEPAVINSLRAESWVSVIMTIGGPASFEDGLAILGETYGLVYSAR